MEQQSSTWVFPTVKSLVTIVYYFLLIALTVFTLMTLMKLFQLQSGSFKVGEEPPNYVAVDVSWSPAINKTMSATGEPPIFLKPVKTMGLIQVPIRSIPGLLTIALGLVSLGVGVWTFLLLRQIFRTVRKESPFHSDIARRITTLGILFLSQTIVESVLKLVLRQHISPYLERFRHEFDMHPMLDITLDGPWLLGLILLALAQVYRRGIELQTENELTV